MARWRRRIITKNLWEMGMNVILGINKWSELTVRGTLSFFLVRMVRLGVHGLLYGGRSFGFSSASWYRNLIEENE